MINPNQNTALIEQFGNAYACARSLELMGVTIEQIKLTSGKPRITVLNDAATRNLDCVSRTRKKTGGAIEHCMTTVINGCQVEYTTQAAG